MLISGVSVGVLFSWCRFVNGLSVLVVWLFLVECGCDFGNMCYMSMRFSVLSNVVVMNGVCRYSVLSSLLISGLVMKLMFIIVLSWLKCCVWLGLVVMLVMYVVVIVMFVLVMFVINCLM